MRTAAFRSDVAHQRAIKLGAQTFDASSMRILVVASLFAMSAVGVVVGLRLLGLARQTRLLPETLMGSGLLIVAVVGGPMSGIARTPHFVGTPFGDTLFSIGLACVQLGIAFFFAFTWQVFRRHSILALLGFVVACEALGATWHGLVAASVGSTMDEIYQSTRPWAMSVVALVALSFLWTAIESLAYYRKLARRLALGLAEPEVANRFWLWGIGALATSGLCAVMLVPMWRGVAPLQSPSLLIVIGIASVVTTSCWFFAFFPPQAYLERLRKQGSAEAAEPLA